MLIKRNTYIIYLLGITSGFTLMIGGNTLNYWLASEQIDIKTIGIFAFLLFPYSINFIWAPIFDTKKVKFLSSYIGDRLAWACLIQWLLILAILILSVINPIKHLLTFAFCTLIVSFLSSTQDSILGALRTEIINPQEQGSIAGIYILGYRMGMLFAGSFAIYLSSFLSFTTIYQLFAFIILIKNILLIFLVKNSQTTLNYPPTPVTITSPLEFIRMLLKPVGSFSFIALVSAFLILYRLPDNFINIMINPFLLRLGFDAVAIASAGKFFGVIGAIIGGFIASYIMRKKGVTESLLIFGILHALAHSLFILQDYWGKNLPMLFLVIGCESITGGMTMAAYIAFIGSLCHGKFRATQYSFFSAMMGISRSILPTFSGYIVSLFGWSIFFFATIIMTIPSLILIPKLTKYLQTKE